MGCGCRRGIWGVDVGGVYGVCGCRKGRLCA